MRGSLAARRSLSELRSDQVEFVSTTGRALAFRRGSDRGVAVAVNSDEQPVTLALGEGNAGEVVHLAGRARDAGDAGEAGAAPVAARASGSDGGLEVTLPPRSGAIIRIT